MTQLSKFHQAVLAAKQQIKEVDISQTQHLLDTDSNAVLVDTREDYEWEKSHLPHAIHIGKGVLERDIEAHIPNTETPIILYCGGGSRSAIAALSLQAMGYTQVMSMDGGFRGWVAAQLPVETTV